MYCRECGKEINEKAIMCPGCGCKNKRVIDTERNKWIALALWFFLGGFGAHRFYVKDSNAGVGYAVCTLLGWVLLGIPYMVLAVLLVIDLVHIIQGELAGVELTD